MYYWNHWRLRYAVRFLPFLASKCDPTLATDLSASALYTSQYATAFLLHRPEALQDTLSCRSRHLSVRWPGNVQCFREQRGQLLTQVCLPFPALLIFRCDLARSQGVYRQIIAIESGEIQL